MSEEISNITIAQTSNFNTGSVCSYIPYIPSSPFNNNPFDPFDNKIQVGYNGVVKIKEHKPKSKEDKWYWEVFYENGSKERYFNIFKSYYPAKKKIVKEKNVKTN